MTRPTPRVFALEEDVRRLFRADATRLAWLDGLRAIAILWVMAYHTFVFVGRSFRHGEHEPLFRIINRGLLGVDVFFVLSGFLIGSILLRQLAGGGIRFGPFYLRRALRILPAYWVTLALYCALELPNARNVWANLLFVNPFLPEREQCLPWGWSLAIEEHFYLVLPVLLAVCARRRRPVLLGLFVLALAVRLGIILRHGLHLPRPDHATLYYDALYDKPQARFGELLAGVIVAERGVVRVRSAHVWTVLALGIVAAVSLIRQPIVDLGWPPACVATWYAVAPLAFAASVAWLIAACLSGGGGGPLLARVLAVRPFRIVAELSYGAYLLHVLVIKVGLELGAIPVAQTVGDMALALVLVPAGCLLAALPMYLLVERPFLRLANRLHGS